MREIKFRVWDSEKKRMLYKEWMDGDGILLLISIHGEICGYVSDDGGKNGLWEHEEEINKGRLILLQYTGLKDRNGREIYEGDIIVIEDMWTDKITIDGGPQEPANHLSPVVFKDGSFGCDILESADYLKKGFISFPMIEDGIGDDPGKLEVIGNIYENPELLEKP